MGVPEADSKEPDPQEVSKARRLFFVSFFDLSWRLLVAMLVPIFIGMFIDSQLNKDKTFAIIGFAVGMIGGILVLRSVIKKLSKGDSLV